MKVIVICSLVVVYSCLQVIIAEHIMLYEAYLLLRDIGGLGIGNNRFPMFDHNQNLLYLYNFRDFSNSIRVAKVDFRTIAFRLEHYSHVSLSNPSERPSIVLSAA